MPWSEKTSLNDRVTLFLRMELMSFVISKCLNIALKMEMNHREELLFHHSALFEESIKTIRLLDTAFALSF